MSGPAQLPAFRDDTGATYPILHGLSRATLEAYGVTGMPTVVVLGAQGAIVGRGEAELDDAIGG